MDRLGLSTKLLHTLQRAGIRTLDELQSYSPDKLALLQGIGSASLAELLGALNPDELHRRLEGNARIAQITNEIARHRQAIEQLEREAHTIRSKALRLRH